MSFVNLMANDIWSDRDLDDRVKAIIRSQVSNEDEMKAARLSRKTDKSQKDLDFINFVDTVIANAIQEGRAAKTDNLLLIETLKVEEAMIRLLKVSLMNGRPEVLNEDGSILIQGIDGASEFIIDENGEQVLDEFGNPAINPEWENAVKDQEERTAAQIIVDSASTECNALIVTRGVVAQATEQAYQASLYVQSPEGEIPQ